MIQLPTVTSFNTSIPLSVKICENSCPINSLNRNSYLPGHSIRTGIPNRKFGLLYLLDFNNLQFYYPIYTFLKTDTASCDVEKLPQINVYDYRDVNNMNFLAKYNHSQNRVYFFKKNQRNGLCQVARRYHQSE